MYILKNLLRKIKYDLTNDNYMVSSDNIAFLNFYYGEWFKNFIEYRFPNRKNYDICFTSINGKRTNLNKYPGKKIFWTGENIEPVLKHYLLQEDRKAGIYFWFNYLQKTYGDYRNKDVELCMGFGANENKYKNYIRFPLWILYFISPNSTYTDVKKVIQNINNSKSLCNKSAVCMNRHDVFGIRTKICDDLKNILNISYPGKWRHNDDDLWKKYEDNKLKYLNLFKFNICAENMDVPYYCTEKIFDCVYGGCIPIYAGCNNNPEPELLNQSFIIKWDLDDRYNNENKKIIKKLLKNEDYYYKFMQQKKLKDSAGDYIMDRLNILENRIRELL